MFRNVVVVKEKQVFPGDGIGDMYLLLAHLRKRCNVVNMWTALQNLWVFAVKCCVALRSWRLRWKQPALVSQMNSCVPSQKSWWRSQSLLQVRMKKPGYLKLCELIKAQLLIHVCLQDTKCMLDSLSIFLLYQNNRAVCFYFHCSASWHHYLRQLGKTNIISGSLNVNTIQNISRVISRKVKIFIL